MVYSPNYYKHAYEKINCNDARVVPDGNGPGTGDPDHFG
jgi:hypothetical protein